MNQTKSCTEALYDTIEACPHVILTNSDRYHAFKRVFTQIRYSNAYYGGDTSWRLNCKDDDLLLVDIHDPDHTMYPLFECIAVLQSQIGCIRRNTASHNLYRKVLYLFHVMLTQVPNSSNDPVVNSHYWDYLPDSGKLPKWREDVEQDIEHYKLLHHLPYLTNSNNPLHCSRVAYLRSFLGLVHPHHGECPAKLGCHVSLQVGSQVPMSTKHKIVREDHRLRSLGASAAYALRYQSLPTHIRENTNHKTNIKASISALFDQQGQCTEQGSSDDHPEITMAPRTIQLWQTIISSLGELSGLPKSASLCYYRNTTIPLLSTILSDFTEHTTSTTTQIAPINHYPPGVRLTHEFLFPEPPDAILRSIPCPHAGKESYLHIQPRRGFAPPITPSSFTSSQQSAFTSTQRSAPQPSATSTHSSAPQPPSQTSLNILNIKH